MNSFPNSLILSQSTFSCTSLWVLGCFTSSWLMEHIYIYVLPDVRIPEREERRLPRQCNSQEGKFITNSSQGFLPQPTQWLVHGQKSPKQRLLAKFIRYAYAVSSWLKLIGYMFAKQVYWYKLLRAFQLSLCFPLGAYWLAGSRLPDGGGESYHFRGSQNLGPGRLSWH